MLIDEHPTKPTPADQKVSDWVASGERFRLDSDFEKQTQKVLDATKTIKELNQ